MNETGTENGERPTEAILQMLNDTESHIVRRVPTLRNLVITQDQTLLCAHAYGRATSSDEQRDPGFIAPVNSVTKSVIALLIGMLIDRGLIKGVDQTLAELLGSRARYLDESSPAAALTLHDLLSMTSGFLWRDARAGIEPMSHRMMRQSDWVEFILSLPVQAERIGQYQYNSAVSHLLSAIIEEAAGESTAAFAETQLFLPLGISRYKWDADPQNINIGGWGLSLSALSMARLGQLCVSGYQHYAGSVEQDNEHSCKHGSEHGDRQILSGKWIEQMWTGFSDADSPQGRNQPPDYQQASYGYQWWIRGNQEIQLFCAEGLGGQMICCIPALRAAVVTTTDSRRGTLLWPLLEQHWIPALVRSL